MLGMAGVVLVGFWMGDLTSIGVWEIDDCPPPRQGLPRFCRRPSAAGHAGTLSDALRRCTQNRRGHVKSRSLLCFIAAPYEQPLSEACSFARHCQSSSAGAHATLFCLKGFCSAQLPCCRHFLLRHSELRRSPGRIAQERGYSRRFAQSACWYE